MKPNTSNRSRLSRSRAAKDSAPRRQLRGERRIGQLLDAAAVVFARDGYALATTNAIAAEADVSPGSLYQFFRNKAQIAEALAEHFVQRLRDVQASIVPSHAREQPLPQLIDSITDRFMSFHQANPAFEALLLGADTSEELAASMQGLYADLVARLDEIIRSRAPANLPIERSRLIAEICILIFKAMLPAALHAEPRRAKLLAAELKRVLAGYLGPVLSG